MTLYDITFIEQNINKDSSETAFILVYNFIMRFGFNPSYKCNTKSWQADVAILAQCFRKLHFTASLPITMISS